MRNFVLAIMLMGAAFAGGAVVNGPGLQWVKERVFSQPADEAGEAAIPEAAPPIISSGIPDASVPPLAGASSSPDQAGAAAGSTPPATGAPPASGAEAVRNERAKAAEAEPTRAGTVPQAPVALAQADAPAPVTALPPLLEAPADTEAAPPSAAEPPREPAPAVTKAPASAPPTQPQAAGPWADAADSGPAQAVPPKGYQKPLDADSAVAAASAPSNDWAALRKQMQTLGVSRYGFEGEPNGKVRFHCVIPLAGRRAVGQQFEAEADDEFAAAQIALRRVALWQATENR